MSGVFGNGSSTLFKYSSEKLNQELMQNPLKVLFADLDESKRYRQISMVLFINLF